MIVHPFFVNNGEKEVYIPTFEPKEPDTIENE